MGELSNPQDHVITVGTLIQRRSEIIFDISAAEKRADALRAQLVHIDAVLRMFRPEFNAEGLPARQRRPTKSAYFKHGEINQRVYAALRKHGSVNSSEVAIATMRDKGLDPDNDQPTRTDFVRRIGLQLGDLHRKGKLEKLGSGSTLRWRLAAD